MPRFRPALALALLLLAGQGAGAQEQRIGLRAGEHPGRSRVVLDWPRRPQYQAEQTEDRLLLRLPAALLPSLEGSGRLARNVLAIARVPEGLLLTLRPGVRVRHFIMDNRLVLDLSDPAAEPDAVQRTAEATPAPRRGRAAPRVVAAVEPGPAVAAPPAPAAVAPPAPAVAAPRVAEAPPQRVPEAVAPRVEAAAPPLTAPVLRLPRPGRPAAPPREAVFAAAPREEVAQANLPPPPRAGAAAVPAAVVVPVVAAPAAPALVAAPAAPALAAAPAAPVLVAAPAVPARVAALARVAAAVPAAPPVMAPVVAAVPAPLATPAPAIAPIVAPLVAPVVPPRPPAVLAPLSAVQARLVQVAGQPPALHLPFNEPAGAAVLRRGDTLLMAFASAQPVDLAALRGSPLFAPMEATPLPGGVVLRLPLAAPAGVQARREGPGWVLHFTRGDERRDGEAEPRTLAPEALAGTPPRFVLRATRPGLALSLTDPETGLPLLLGTVLEAGQAVPLPRRLAEFELPPTLLGLAVLARSDSVTLAPQNDRFVIAAAGGAQLALDPAAAAAAGGAPAMTRSFDLPAIAVPALLNRLRAQQGGIAGAAPLARAPARRDAAETLLALGLGQEAQAMAGLAMAEDPAAAADPRTIGLAAAAAVLAGRVAEARPLRDAALPESDETTLWRAALAALEAQPERAAAGFAATLPLLLDYPAPLRARLLPLAAEALAEAGEHAALAQLLAATPEGLALPRAMQLQAAGKPAEALAAYEAIAAGSDRRARALALRRVVDLKLASGALDAAGAARVLDSALFAWRGDEVELALRRRLAELRVQAKEPRVALALLQETVAMFPEQAAALRPAMVAALLAAVRDEPPLAAVVLHDTQAELLQGDPRAEEAAALLAERLVALDLTDRAATLLARAADRATEPARRAALGLRLAGLKLDEGNAAAALAALEATKGEALPEALSRDRVVLAARAEARRGNLPQAVEGLQALGDAGAAPLSDLLAEAQEWPAAAAAGARVLLALPAAPAALDAAQQRTLLRQAALLVLAGDEAGLAVLRTAQGGRLPAGPLAEGFAALTAESLKGLADLPRLAREQQLFRNLPRRLEALRAGAPVTR